MHVSGGQRVRQLLLGLVGQEQELRPAARLDLAPELYHAGAATDHQEPQFRQVGEESRCPQQGLKIVRMTEVAAVRRDLRPLQSELRPQRARRRRLRHHEGRARPVRNDRQALFRRAAREQPVPHTPAEHDVGVRPSHRAVAKNRERLDDPAGHRRGAEYRCDLRIDVLQPIDEARAPKAHRQRADESDERRIRLRDEDITAP